MPLAGTVLVACAALYAQAAVVYAWLWMYGTRRDAVSLGLAGTALGATAFSLGGVFLTVPGAQTGAELGARLLHTGTFVAVPSFLGVALTLAGRPVPRSVLAVGGVVALGAVAASALGLVHDPASVMPGLAREPDLTPLGMGLVSAAVVGITVAVTILAWAAQRRAGARWILLGVAPGAFAGVLEQVARAGGHEPLFLAAPFGTTLMLVASWVLLRRFGAVGDGLRAQKEALQRSHAALLVAQRDQARAEQLADVGELSVVLAGEISRPMASLRRSVQHLDLATVESGEARATLDEIDAETRHLNDLVGDLLVFARPSQEERRVVRVATLVEDAVRDAGAHARSEPDVEVDVDRSLRIECEPEAMRRAVAQLVENAATAAKDERIRVSAHADDAGFVRLDVTDPGEGMDSVVRKRAFEPFFTTRPYGTGLGLAIVARVARAHRGSVEIESAHGCGTTVSLRLPLSEAARESVPAG